MNTRTQLALAIGSVLLFPTMAFAGLDFTAGDWKIDISGNVNAFYVGADCDNGPAATTAIVGGLACTGSRSTAVRNGLLPAALVFSATTHQDDYDVGVTIGLYPGINSSAAAGVNGPGLPAALQSPGIDARQAFFTVGQDWGSFKLGRDIGIFGKDAILDDMTLLGVGSVGNNAAPSNTSLGRIGLGYLYTDWEPQITYTTPNFSGFSASTRRVPAARCGRLGDVYTPQFAADPGRRELHVGRSEIVRSVRQSVGRRRQPESVGEQ